MIEVQGLTKRYGPEVAVDRLSFTVRPGTVTGFLGPNGSGKSTTLQMIMGLDFPDSGQTRIGGRPYRELNWPLREVGALLEARAFHPGRTARSHLAALAASNRIPGARVDEALATVGLAEVAGRRAGKFSPGDLTPGQEEQARPEHQRRERDLHDVLGGEHQPFRHEPLEGRQAQVPD
jgi:ABC-2 type transport system ATP-binding protein